MFIFLAAVLGTMNVVGGYVVTDRMLEMFKSSKNEKKEEGGQVNGPWPQPLAPSTSSLGSSTCSLPSCLWSVCT